MTIIQEPTYTSAQEPIPIRHLSDYDPVEQEELAALADSLLRITQRMGHLAWPDRIVQQSLPRSVSSELAQSAALAFESAVDQTTTPESQSRETRPTRELSEAIQQLIIHNGTDRSMNVEDFRQQMREQGIDPEANDTLQALLFGLDEEMFSTEGDTVTAAPEMQDA